MLVLNMLNIVVALHSDGSDFHHTLLPVQQLLQVSRLWSKWCILLVIMAHVKLPTWAAYPCKYKYCTAHGTHVKP